MPIIAVCGQKGGCGKSTVARALAVYLASKKKSVAIADLDTYQRTATEWAEARRQNGRKPDIRVELVDIESDWQSAVKDAEYLIFDCPGWSDQHTAKIAEVADLLLLPTGPSSDDLRPLIRLVFDLEGIGIPTERIAVILQRIHTDAEERRARKYLQEAEVADRLLSNSIPDQTRYGSLLSVGGSITEAGGDAGKVMDDVMARLKAAGARRAKTDVSKLDFSWL